MKITFCERCKKQTPNGTRFCSKSCSNAHIPRKKKTTIACLQCGNQINRIGKSLRKQTCSVQCFNAYQLENGMSHPCDKCAKPTPNSKIFCSRACQPPLARTRRHPRSLSTPKQVDCAQCGKRTVNKKFCSRECSSAAQRNPVERAEAQRESANQRRNEHRKQKRLAGFKKADYVSSEERANMYAMQGGLCAIRSCSKEARVLDHNHSTGHVRGLLCHMHNTALGAFNDDIDFLLEGVEYLKSYLLKAQ